MYFLFCFHQYNSHCQVLKHLRQHYFSMSTQVLGDTCCVLPEETDQLQPPHQSQQSLLYLSGDGWNQSYPLYRLREWPASLLATGASQRRPGGHEQRRRGLCDVNSKCRSHCNAMQRAVVLQTANIYDTTRLSHQFLKSLCAIVQSIFDSSSNSSWSAPNEEIKFCLFCRQYTCLWSVVFQAADIYLADYLMPEL